MSMRYLLDHFACLFGSAGACWLSLRYDFHAVLAECESRHRA